ncbi:hypothetical protein KZ813_14600 [Sphingomonas sp. RHCKR7]|uniref:hypothetical protein n=1 Tax=Sphingomonas folli TaxID=2862497 RepID=UPI001CA5B48C|nr:hypothetical protein [Sphingomonas folli]MBW6528070.1 hypothetical protein [Sphingomonas folli]
MRRGRALRCWGLLLALWVSARAAWLWQERAPAARRAAIAASVIAPRPTAPLAPRPGTIVGASVAPERRPGHVAVPRPAAPHPPTRSPRLILAARSVAPPALPPARPAEPDHRPSGGPTSLGLDGTAPPIGADAAPRWSQTGWLLLRGGAATSTAAPQLGGAQVGARVARVIDDDARLAVSLRLVSAVRAREREAIAAVEWQPRTLPLRLLAERRVGVAGLRGGWGLGATGGISDRAIGAGALLDGYVQAGAIERRGGYADSAVSLERPVATRDGATLRLGVGAWGAAQRGAGRLDLGPTATLRLGHARATLAWRARVAGDARPGSGAALTIGIDR